MGSSRALCETIESKNEFSTAQRPQAQPVLKKCYSRCVEDDINKLFEAVNVRTSKSLDLSESESWRNGSKRSMRSPGSNSPGTGFSEPVSLKQALRGLCISQAAETAAIKRLSMTSASPRISEAGKHTNLFRSVVTEAGGSGCSPTQESISFSSRSLTWSHRSCKSSPVQSSSSSPGRSIKQDMKSILSISIEPGHQVADCDGYDVEKSITNEENVKCNSSKQPNQSALSSSQIPSTSVLEESKLSPVCKEIAQASEVDTQVEIAHTIEEKHNLLSVVPHHNSHDGQKNVASGPIKNSASSLKVVKRAGPRLRRKSKLQTAPLLGAARSNKDVRLAKITPHNVSTGARNKNLIIMKSKKVAASAEGSSKSSDEVNSSLDRGSGQLICQRCQCALKDTNVGSSDNPLAATTTESFTGGGNHTALVASKSDSIPSSWENRATTQMAPPHDKGTKFVNCSAGEEHLEFELF
ncbi:hypothetical protein SASPL_111754 [Salvia splendens]|uniref:Uncharacterized protein n=1 Tax=Salvia splendens TaxID=180675 RepID=A0A8X8Y7U5_SALSN|nr:hypothetical protein SASPL_111754 [Salvia splendens]